MLKPLFVKATTIPDAWHSLILAAPDYGHLFTIDRGSYVGEQRLEFDALMLQITHPEVRPFEPDMPPHMVGVPPPVAPGYIDEYITYLMTADKKPNEDYTYGSRLREAMIPQLDEKVSTISSEYNILTPYSFIDQVQMVIDKYRQYGFRNNQLCMEVGHAEDLLLTDPACLRLIDSRIQDGKLHLHLYFRSWDLWSGMPSNLGALQLLKEYMAGEIGVEPGEFMCYSKGAHFYGYVVSLVYQRCMRENVCE